MSEVVLDHIESIKFLREKLPIKNWQLLEHLPNAIFSIAEMTRQQEIHNKKQSLVFNQNPPSLLVTSFDWFVMSATNYVRTVGLVDFIIKNELQTNDFLDIEKQKEIKIYCTEYVKKVLPAVSQWRNKVSAHPSATDPKKHDNIATLEHSLMSWVTFISPYYSTSLKWNSLGAESELPGWALTQVYEEKLMPRYWPDKKLSPIP